MTAIARVRRVAVAVAVILATLRTAGADALGDIEAAQRALHARVAPAVVYLRAGDSVGSGFFVDRGVVLTNRHVVGARSTVEVVLHDGRKITGEVIERASSGIDLVLVRVPANDVAPLELWLAAPQVGAWIASIGHGVDSPWTFTTGMVSNVYKNRAGLPVLQTQIPLNPGSSGSPIVDRQGRVIAVVAKGVTEANSVNFAIGIRVAVRELRGLSAARASVVIRAPAGTPIFIDGQLAGKGPELTVELEPGNHKVSAVVAGALRELAIEAPRHEPVELR